MPKKRVCIVEPCHSHEEVIFPQIELLKDDYHVYVLAPQSLLDVEILKGTQHLYTAVPFRWRQKDCRLKRFLCTPRKYWDIRMLVDRIAPEVVIFNSTYHLLDLLLITFLFKRYRKVQIIHHFQSFFQPGMRGIYNQFDANLVISEEVHHYIVQTHPEFYSLEYFLPIFFDSILLHPSTVMDAANVYEDGQLQLGVFGSVDRRRRNYAGLLSRLVEWKNRGVKSDFCIHLVGELPNEYRKFIKQNHLVDVVHCHDEFVSFTDLSKIIQHIDVILFLIDSSVPSVKTYNYYGVSGTSTLIKGFRKACASSRDFKVDATLLDKCFLYDGDHVEQLFQQIADGKITKSIVRTLEAKYQDMPLFSRQLQKQRLLSILKRAVL